MQQVKADARFWWRVLDAHLPAEPRPAPAAFTPSQRPAPAPHRLHSQPAAQPSLPLRLEIPTSDRRPARRSRAAARSAGRVIAAFSVLLACTAGAGAAIVTGWIEPHRIQLLVSGEAQDALLKLGFGIDQVSLQGHHFTPDADVYGALDLASARTFAAFDADAALRRIEALPWVETAQITRIFPGALRVDIRERRPAALWSLKGRNFLVDATGRVLGAAAEPHGWQLPRIAGEGANAEATLLFTALARHPAIADEVDRAERIGSRRWSLVLHNGSRLELGADREVEGLDRIAGNAELRQALSGPPMIADVRTPGRMTLRAQSAASAGQAAAMEARP